MEQPQYLPPLVTLKCVKEKSRLRIKIITPGYIQGANCQFPKDIRVDGREYTVPRQDVVMADTRGKFFYRIKKNNIKIVETHSNAEIVSKDSLTVYSNNGDDDAIECSICMEGLNDDPSLVFVIFVPCGHYCCCQGCGKSLKTCCMCRADIRLQITKDQLQ